MSLDHKERHVNCQFIFHVVCKKRNEKWMRFENLDLRQWIMIQWYHTSHTVMTSQTKLTGHEMVHCLDYLMMYSTCQWSTLVVWSCFKISPMLALTNSIPYNYFALLRLAKKYSFRDTLFAFFSLSFCSFSFIYREKDTSPKQGLYTRWPPVDSYNY